jgi:RNA polymerase sigma-70 factor (ECF subfamily)
MVTQADDSATLLTRLRAGDAQAFAALVDRHHGAMVRLARTFVSSDAVAQEVAQDAWSAALSGLASFEGRSSFKTWLFRIVVNRAKTRGVRDARSVPMSALGAGAGDGDDAGDEPAVNPDRFTQRGMWAAPPREWELSPEELLGQRQTLAALEHALAALPERQRQVVLLRDMLGWTSEEVCNVLEVTETNERVLLHRARARLRTALEAHLATP